MKLNYLVPTIIYGILSITLGIFEPVKAQESSNLLSANSDYEDLYKKAIVSDSIYQLKYLSRLTIMLREEGNISLSNTYLNEYLKNPLALYPERATNWIADNYILIQEYEKARKYLKILKSKYSSILYYNNSWGNIAYETLFYIHLELHEFEDIDHVISEFMNTNQKVEDAPEIYYLIGKQYIKSGKYKLAKKTFHSIIQSPDLQNNQRNNDLIDKAKEELKYLDSTKEWFRDDSNELMKEISKYLSTDNIDDLEKLASPINFDYNMVGVNYGLKNKKIIRKVLESIISDTTVSIRIMPNNESKNKKFYYSIGWQSDILSETILFYTQLTQYGWEWRGIFLSEKPENDTYLAEYYKNIPKENEQNPVLLASAKSKGGSLTNLGNSGSGLTVNIPAPWISGKCMASGSEYTIYTPFTCCASIYGMTGSYYDQGKHKGKEYYAIDFNYYVIKCIVPPYCVSLPGSGRWVSSVANGEISDIKRSNGQVDINHKECGPISDMYSRYAHMKNIFWPIGLYIPKGLILGTVSNVGDATFSHLHFAVFKKESAGDWSAVRPATVNGVARDTDGDFACIESTNSLPSMTGDADGDGIVNAFDNCVNVSNPDQDDMDDDCIGDACDDYDGDGIADAYDNCKYNPNPSQSDIDGDGWGNVCDADPDGDEVECRETVKGYICNDDVWDDNCDYVANPDQLDMDDDDIGDACDWDMDGDEISDHIDWCPTIYDTENLDSDGDRIGDVCDNCPHTNNPDQADANSDGEGDVCDEDDDTDGDGIVDKYDNCVIIPNPSQENRDWDNIGDACDPNYTPPPWENIGLLEPPLEFGIDPWVLTDHPEVILQVDSVAERYFMTPLMREGYTDAYMVDITVSGNLQNMQIIIYNSYGQRVPFQKNEIGNQIILSFHSFPGQRYSMVFRKLDGTTRAKKDLIGYTITYNNKIKN
jgi:hypothetical protein